MKKRSVITKLPFWIIILGLSPLSCSELLTPTEVAAPYEVIPVGSNLRNPMAIDTDDKGNIWVAEAGTGNHDGAIVMISPEGTKTTLTSGFYSVNGTNGVDGLTGIVVRNNRWLTVLNGAEGMIYSYNISNFESGSPPLPIDTYHFRDYGSTSRAHRPSDRSRIFDFTLDEVENCYFVDAGANLILKWYYLDGSISVFAEIPELANGTKAVPTGIVYDGNQLLVSTFSSSPYTAGTSRIYAVDLAGNVSIYKEGLTTAARLDLTANKGLLITKFGDYFGDTFNPNTGAILNEKGEVLVKDLPQPIDVKSIDNEDFYFLSNQTGTIYRVSLTK